MSGERDDPDDREGSDRPRPDPDEDPFETFDREYADREGDPFEHLDAPDRDRGAGGPDGKRGAGGPDGKRGAGGPDGKRGAGGPDGKRGAGGPGGKRGAGGPGGDREADAADPFEYGDDRRGERAGERRAEGSRGRRGDRDGEGSAGDRAGRPGNRGGRQSTDDAERRDVNVRAGDPLSDVEVSGEDPFESGTSAFEDAGVEGVDPDEVWERLTGEGEAARAEPEGEDDVVEVSKHAFCEGCEHFSPPPNVRCGHEGTAILEFTDLETVRVVDCPVVAERKRLQQE
jgi:hypothetical protein